MVNVVKEGVVQEGEVREGEIAKKDAEVEKARAEKRALEKRLQTVLNKLRVADDEIERLWEDLKVAREMVVVRRDRVVELERKLAEGEERKLGEEKSGGIEDGCEGDGRMEAEDEGVLELMASEGEMAAASDEVEMKSVAGNERWRLERSG